MMKAWRALAVVAIGTTAMVSGPASAQFFMQSMDIATMNGTGDPSGLGALMPGATEEELQAARLWNVRAALNVAALQCQFEPTLLVVDNYNALLADHKAELDKSVKTLDKYFKRMNKTPKAGQMAYDQFNTKTYASFTTVGGKMGFCQTANAVGRDALFVGRGELGALADKRLRDLRASLTPFGEQRFTQYRYLGPDQAWLPRLDVACWNKKGEWVYKKCGDQMPVTAVSPAAATPAAALPAAVQSTAMR